jgi:hypothetical protein
MCESELEEARELIEELETRLQEQRVDKNGQGETDTAHRNVPVDAR